MKFGVLQGLVLDLILFLLYPSDNDTLTYRFCQSVATAHLHDLRRSVDAVKSVAAEDDNKLECYGVRQVVDSIRFH